VGVLKRARSEGGEVRIVCTQPRVRKVFEITRLDSAFDLFDSIDEAVRGARE
jgi:anti-sigma B factor antagonist